MKILLIAFLLSFPTTILRGQDLHYEIKGKIHNSHSQAKVFISYRLAGKEYLDSTLLQNGSFSFSGYVNRPVPATVLIDYNGTDRLKSKDKIIFYLENGIIQLVAKDSIRFATITGGIINNDYTGYKKMLAVPDKSLDDLNEKWANATQEQKTDSVFRTGFVTIATPIMEEKAKLQKKFIADNPNSYISLVALRELAGSIIDYPSINPLFVSLSPEIRNTTAGREFTARLEKANSVSVGKMAPQFSQNDSLGHPVKLSDFAGKYVLVDFWASWCGPCRADNPNIVKAYTQFKERNFTILSVSLDRDEKNWKRAINNDNLTWTNVSDLKYWDNEVAKLYDVRSIPANYLLDPSGKIIAKNLNGEGLAKKLAEIITN